MVEPGRGAATGWSAPMVGDEVALAVLIRQLQWALDDAAHEWAAGRVTPRSRAELAEALESLATIVRATIPGEVIDSQG